ncbi:MAG TPA: von Willebrand factor type A domain-containing protein [Phycisphaerae bacterium]|nr:von Willebrand factor type A domain-containing protein [Phycisphaerae bacterium]
MKTQMDDPRLTAYALGELDGAERVEVEALVASSAEARGAVEDVRRTAALLEEELAKEPVGSLGDEARQRIESRILAGRIRRWGGYAAAACVVLLVGGFAASVMMPSLSRSRSLNNDETQLALGPDRRIDDSVNYKKEPSNENPAGDPPTVVVVDPETGKLIIEGAEAIALVPPFPGRKIELNQTGGLVRDANKFSAGGRGGGGVFGGGGGRKRTNQMDNAPSLTSSTENIAGLRALGYLGDSTKVTSGYTDVNDDGIAVDSESTVLLEGSDEQIRRTEELLRRIQGDPEERRRYIQESSGETYDGVVDNPFLAVLQSPLSTFSIDVDTASYANVRRMLNCNQLPPAAAVRIEEMVNYFSYDYPQPEGDQPFSVTIETVSCPWSAEHRLIRVGLKGREIPQEKRLPCNLVFLIDVSGSMNSENKLPLVKQGLAMLVQQLSPEDRVAMVVYAGASGLALPSTPVSQKDAILSTIDHLEAGGSTNGGEGIQLAYKIAGEHLNKEGVNRVILATDGDFNVGVTDQKDLVKLVEEKAKGGVFLSVLGFGMGNYKDATLEKLADKGNGNYAYIDTFAEAKKVLVDQMAGTLVTIAKDVKIQIEFNPGQVAAYRLIGYENRILAAADFNNDMKDAGEIGAGHTVTALYEIVPTSASTVGVDPLKYQPVVEGAKDTPRTASDELLTLKLRYKRPDGDTSKLIESPVKDSQRSFDDASDDLKFAASVAAFGMLLRNSPHKGDLTYDAVLTTATRSMGKDASGYRAEFVDLVRKAKGLSGRP